MGEGRAIGFFSDWILRSAVPGSSRWETVSNGVSVAFALGNLARHGLHPRDGVAERARAFAATAPFVSLNRLAVAFHHLPDANAVEPISGAVRVILEAVQDEGPAPRRA